MFSVYRLPMASVKLAGKLNPPSFEDGHINVYAYLAISEQAVILVDTGVGFGDAYIDKQFEPERNSLLQLLNDFDVVPADVTHIINTHLHFDHCGNNRLFPKAKIVVQAQELEVAREKYYTISEWFDYEGAKIEPVSGDALVVEGFRVLHTPGHTPGHQSALIATAEGDVLIAAQAAFRVEEYQQGGDPETQAHDGLSEAYCESIAKLSAIEAVDVCFSHDDRTLSQSAVHNQ